MLIENRSKRQFVHNPGSPGFVEPFSLTHVSLSIADGSSLEDVKTFLGGDTDSWYVLDLMGLTDSFVVEMGNVNHNSSVALKVALEDVEKSPFFSEMYEQHLNNLEWDYGRYSCTMG